MELARINHQADLQAEHLSAVGYVGKRAMREVTLLNQLDVQPPESLVAPQRGNPVPDLCPGTDSWLLT